MPFERAREATAAVAAIQNQSRWSRWADKIDRGILNGKGKLKVAFHHIIT